MKTKLIALAVSFGIVFALASTGFAQERDGPSANAGTLESGQLESGSAKRSLPRGAAPEAQGGTIESGQIVYF